MIELLTIIAIMAAMVAVSVVSVRAGQTAARTRGAARDIFAMIRHARSSALITQQPAIITYSTEQVDGEVCAKVMVTGAKLIDNGAGKGAVTLSGKKVETLEEETGEALGEGGQTIEDVLFAQISSDVVKGIRIKVLKEGESLGGEADEDAARPKISVFSNVDYLLGRFSEKQRETEEQEKSEDAEKTVETDDEAQEPVSIVWETNGRTEPHKVYVYQDGSKPEKGLCIAIDRFGGAKVLGSGEDDR